MGDVFNLGIHQMLSPGVCVMTLKRNFVFWFDAFAAILKIYAKNSTAMRTVSGALRPTGCMCSATSSPHRFTVTVLRSRNTRRPGSSRIVFQSISYVSHPCFVSGLADLS